MHARRAEEMHPTMLRMQGLGEIVLLLLLRDMISLAG
jgi:hypothetical protein